MLIRERPAQAPSFDGRDIFACATESVTGCESFDASTTSVVMVPDALRWPGTPTTPYVTSTMRTINRRSLLAPQQVWRMIASLLVAFQAHWSPVRPFQT